MASCLDEWFSNTKLRNKEGEREGGGQTVTGDNNGKQSRLSFPSQNGGGSMEDGGRRTRSRQGNTAEEEEEEEEGDWRVTRRGRA